MKTYKTLKEAQKILKGLPGGHVIEGTPGNWRVVRAILKGFVLDRKFTPIEKGRRWKR